ncbi:amino acid adenylation domain-containing protein [Bacillus pseudomycoides]|uniref:non-ribosomal peptide synthetase n=1 Tax=Bacillus TaxID=1386 RepID=UPI00224989C4|nr:MULTISPECIES: non-ribosomal peptide synthetase [Bacillus]MCX2829639.1 amino acid adenylation domain-containing protein [Bacillus sp. DHT2]MDR4916754.1 amino acid adenylation domain-containing protein [Bacillus pseudomycoides]
MGIIQKLEKDNIENISSLTSIQQAILFDYITDKKREYIKQLSLTLSGDIKLNILQQAWDCVINSNEMLRTVFRWEELNEPEQITLKKNRVQIKYYDLTRKAEKYVELQKIKSNDLKRGIDITKETLRIYLCKLDENKYEMIISNHNIIYDRQSNNIILKELIETYNNVYKGLKPSKINKIKFVDFMNRTNLIDKNEQKKFWSDYFEGLKMDKDLFYSENNNIIKEYFYSFSASKSDKIKQFANEHRISLSAIFYGVWGVLLQKLNNSNEALFGTTVSLRNENIENAVGLFINRIPLRVDSTSITFMELICNIEKSLNERKYFENTPLIDIERYLSKEINKEFISSTVTIEDKPIEKNCNKESKLCIEDYSLYDKTNYKMALEVSTYNSFVCKYSYNPEVINESEVVKLAEYLNIILENGMNNKNIQISEIELLSKAEKEQILYEFNDTKVEYPEEKTIQELFEEQVNKTPNRIAVVFENQQITYKELNEKANSLARVLRGKGVKAESIVGIMAEKSLEMVIGIIGILKAGGAYLPIDPEYPDERINYILNDSRCELLLSTNDLLKKIDFNGDVVNLSNKELFQEETHNLEIANNSDNLAYILYTSGTTGNPKGVMCVHKNIIRLVKNASFISFKDDDRILQTGSIMFDASTFEIWGALLNNLQLCLIKTETLLSPFLLEKAIIRNKITTLWLTSELFNQLADENDKIFEKLRCLLVGGDVLSTKYINLIRNKYSDLKIINGYGPTENTTFSTTFLVDDEYYLNIPIGKPISNSKVYIIDKDNNLMPIGTPGELCVSGDGLARGYINKPELTKEKFVDNPFEIGKKMYKTGDLARWLPNGNVEFLGRIDNQVKIRGFRIELGEIENRLLQHKDIKEAVVVVRDNVEKGKCLCAYIVCMREYSDLELKDYLSTNLPEYMIPSYFVNLERMPVTLNGKLDRKALPKPNVNEIVLNKYEAPSNKLEEILTNIWSITLGVEKIGTNDNFFDLGGNSLNAITIIAKIHKELNKEITIKDIFNSPTIKEQRILIEKIDKNMYSIIEKVDERDSYGASSAQKRMYLVQQFFEDNTAYNIPLLFEIEGDVDKGKMEKTFKELVKRHESLRTYFAPIEGEIVQKIDQSYDFTLVKSENNKDINMIVKEFIRSFNLEQSPLLRVELVKSRGKVYLLIDMNHIIVDGISINILIKEFIALYNGEELAPSNLQYRDFSTWQNNYLKSEKIKQQEEYWLNLFNDQIPVLDLPYDYERPAHKTFEGDTVNFHLSEKRSDEVRILAKKTGTTIHMVMLSALNILLSKYSGQEDIVIGVPVAGRSRLELENIVGMFVNTLALRNKPEKSKKYINFLKEVKNNSLKAYEYQDYQFETLVERLNIERNINSNPLFNIMLNIVDIENTADIKLDELLLKRIDYNSTNSKFDMTLNVLEKDNIFKFSLEYCSKLFKKETIKRMKNHFLKILDEITINPEKKISEIELLMKEERDKILYKFNNTKAEYPEEKTIHELFEEQVEKTPNSIAVTLENKQLTYRELNEEANSLARVLRGKGVKADSIVGIMVERSPELIIGIMGILKAGGAYLPIDPSYPKERINFILDDSRCEVLLSSDSLTTNIEFKGEILDLLDKHLFKEESSNLEKINTSRDLAYVIYTSGTTGNPKGVMIEHKSLVNYVVFSKNKYGINEKFYMPFYTSVSFDLTITSIFTPLVSGNTMVIYSDGDIHELVNDVFLGNDSSIVKLTPAHLGLIKEMKYLNKSIKKIIVGGEDLTEELAKNTSDLFENRVDIINEYGPTEATVGCVVHSYNYRNKYKNSVLIGKPISNSKVYIVDGNSKLMPIGVPGELCISGDGLARGYLNRCELTNEKFVDNPFEHGKKMYRTGDLARWLPDGNIECLGRIDNQVKIRGFRIELGEIENKLLQHEKIKEVAVVVKEHHGKEKYICAYIVSGSVISELNLKDYLKESLPEYMIPSYFKQIEELPLTLNGKLDRRALPELNRDEYLNKYEAPRSKVEELLVKVWEDVLSVERIGINDNFFELGGHSLKAALLMAKIHKELDVVIPLKVLFSNPTVNGLIGFIKNAQKSKFLRIEKSKEKEYYQASSAQKRMYMLQKFNGESTAYNMPIIMEVCGEVDVNRIEKAFLKLMNRHEIFKTSFKMNEYKIVQKFKSLNEFKLTFRKENKDVENVLRGFVKPFELEKAPLFRAELIETDGKTFLLMDMHHIISDGISMNIILKEFKALYNGEELATLRIQYKDFAKWQNELLESEVIREKEEYWMNIFKGEIPVLNLPYDYERPAIKSYEGANLNFTVNEEITEGLRKLSRKTGSTIHMVLLSVFNILLSKYSGQEEIVVGVPVAGRQNVDLQNIVGMFVNTLAIKSNPSGEKEYIELLEETKENLLTAYENQDYQLEKLIDKLSIKRDTSRNPLFDVLFNVEDTIESQDIVLDKVMLKLYDFENLTSQFDLTLNVIKRTKTLELNFNYCTKLFNKETIVRMFKHFTKILKEIVKNSYIKLSDIHFLTESELQKINEFNDTVVNFPDDKAIQELFEEQVEKTPDGIAVIFGDKYLTYRELNEKANCLARVLREKGVKSDVIVGIMVERSLEMIIGIMGILKSGGAYLPIDPNYPEERKQFLLKDSGSKVLLSKKTLIGGSNLFQGEILDLSNSVLFEGKVDNLEKINRSSDLAYVIYTSGTTGNPKGVMIEHKSLINRLNWMQKKYPLTEKDTILQKTTYAFDVSVWEILWWSIVGAKVCMLGPNNEKDPQKIIEAIKQYEITTMHFVPSMLDVFLFYLEENNDNESFSSLRQVFCSGEALNHSQVSRFFRRMDNSIKLINLYGPTEATIDVTYFECNHEITNVVPIGKPIDNTKLYILNGNGPVPIGVKGELYISGAGLARGYLNRQDLTSEKFINNPFEPGTIMYQTGDLARWLPDGNIEYLGRIDNQVKIRGHRIELGEIENSLLNYKEIKEAVVVAKSVSANQNYLCAFLISNKKINMEEVKNSLKEKLPDYMIPVVFIQLEKLPQTINGKVDRKTLLEMNVNIPERQYEKPSNKIEKLLHLIWKELLGIEEIGVKDDFFEIGGNSLLVIKLHLRIKDSLNLEIPIADLYRYTTIELISEKIKGQMEILDYAIIEKNLEKEIGGKYKFKKVQINKKEYITLYTNKSYEEIFPYLRNYISPSKFPHYIRPFNHMLENKVVPKRIQAENKIRSEDTNNKIIEKYIDRQASYLNLEIKSKQIVDRYKVSYLQNAYITKKFKSILITKIQVFDEMNLKHIKEALKETLNMDSVFKSVIDNNKDSINFIEYEKIKDFDMEVLNLSMYTEETKQKIEEKICDYATKKLISQNPIHNLLFNLLIIKKNEKDYDILFFVDHNIFDGASKKILMVNFFDNLKKINQENSKPDTEKGTYKEYIYSINENTNIEKIEKIKKYLTYEEYLLNVKKLKGKFETLKTDVNSFNSECFQYYYDQDVSYGLPNGDKNFGLSLYIVMKICEILFEENKIPIKIIRDGRVYHEKFKRLIGDCHVSHPILCSTNSINECYKDVVSFENEIFINEGFDIGDLVFGNKLYDLQLQELMISTFMNFNYIGELTEDEELILMSEMKKSNRLNVSIDYPITAYSVENKIGVVLPWIIKDKMKEIKELDFN